MSLAITVSLFCLLITHYYGSAFPSNSLEGSASSGLDYNQYKYAEAVSNVHALENDEDLDEVYHNWQTGKETVNTVYYQHISTETINKICSDFNVIIIVKSDNSLIDCSERRLALPVYAEDEETGRIKRGAEINETIQLNENDKKEIETPPVTHLNHTKINSTESNKNVMNETIAENTIQQYDLKNATIENQEQNTSNVTDVKNVSNEIISDNKANSTGIGIKTNGTNTNGKVNATKIDSTVDKMEIGNATTSENKTDILPTTLSTSDKGTIKNENKKLIHETFQNNNTLNATLPNMASKAINKTDKENKTLGVTGAILNETKEVEHKVNKTTDLETMEREDKKIDLSAINANTSVVKEGTPLSKNSTQLKENSAPKTDESTKKTSTSSTIIWFVFGGIILIGGAVITFKMMRKKKPQSYDINPNQIRRNINETSTDATNISNREQEMKPLMSKNEEGTRTITEKNESAVNNQNKINNTQEIKMDETQGNHASEIAEDINGTLPETKP